MSADWDRYSTAEECKARANEPRLNGVVSLAVGPVRAIDGMTVDHDPVPQNRAHSAVRGMLTGPKPSERKTMVRYRLLELCRADWALEPDEWPDP